MRTLFAPWVSGALGLAANLPGLGERFINFELAILSYPYEIARGMMGRDYRL